ncbi:MAG: hypothetical protein D6737_05140 [Chloroflexi bacterium]|nr:MAG: hypothetical protein CUN54_01965 [Phototrophicales bacterium]RMF81374.1 MAG: hypothetical protein D6737_05140 [Chloroflexota bacterium]
MRKYQIIGILFGMGVLFAACTNLPSPRREILFGNPRLRYDFVDSNTNWDTYRAAGQRALFQINDGVLEGAVVGDAGFIWSLNHERHHDLAVRVQIRQIRGESGNGFYGIMCRADELGNGYYFLISSGQRFSISKATPQTPDLIQLTEWQGSEVIQAGDTVNELVVVCSGNYLAMFVNDVFLADAIDDDYSTGTLGVALAAVDNTVWVQYDDIVVQDVVVYGG